MKPTIGRIVNFKLGDMDHAAIIAHVHNDTCVNLCIIDANGNTFNRTSVTQGDRDQQWNWPVRVDENGVKHIKAEQL